MPDHMGGESFRLDIVALKSEVPVFVRLRAVIKRLLRHHQFRLTSVVSTTPQLPPEAPAVPSADAAGGAADR